MSDPTALGGLGVQPITSTLPTGYTPTDLRAAYLIPVSTTTVTVAVVVAYDAPAVERDLGVYRSTYKMPACTTANGCFKKVNQRGVVAPLPKPSPPAANWAAETTLDVDMVSAICPSCHILLVEADDDDRAGDANMELAVQQAVTLGAKYVSMSWGVKEDKTEAGADTAYFGAKDVAYVAAAGDSDYGTSWPAVNPNVVSVGGTTLLRATNARGWKETVWGLQKGKVTGSKLTGTGSGCSAYEPRPPWQGITAITSVCKGRAMNDLSAVADPNHGVLSYQGGKWYVYGGTSVGAPMITAMFAMAGVSTGAAAAPYKYKGKFTDIADNSANSPGCKSALCSARTGWDGPTGMGTPIGLQGFGAAGNTITIHNPGTVTSYVGTAATANVKATNSAKAVVTYVTTGLPPGITMRPGGLLSGRPTRAGAYAVTVSATDVSRVIASTHFLWSVVTPHVGAGHKSR